MLDIVAAALQSALRSNMAPEFAQAWVRTTDNCLLVIPGIIGTKVTFGPHANDPATVTALGLDPEHAHEVPVMASEQLIPFPAFSNPRPEVQVTIGGIGPRTVKLFNPPQPPPASLNSAAGELQNNLHFADLAPTFRLALVVAVDGLARLDRYSEP